MTERIFYFEIDGLGNETAAFPITLSKEGVADLSALPAMLQDTLKTTGVMTTGSERSFFPSDGSAFLDALLTSANPYFRFRSHPELHNIAV